MNVQLFSSMGMSSPVIGHLPKPWGNARYSITWNLKMALEDAIFLYDPVVFKFHVNLPGCTKNVQKQGANAVTLTTHSRPLCPSLASGKPPGPSNCRFLALLVTSVYVYIYIYNAYTSTVYARVYILKKEACVQALRCFGQ